MKHKAHNFVTDDTGAVSTDFVVLAGALLALGLATANAVRLGTFDGGDDINNHLKGCVTTGGGTTDLSRCN